MWWTADQLASVDSAVASAAGGSPALLSIEGDAGQGKSTLLREVRRRLDGFDVLAGEGIRDSVGEPAMLLRRWNVVDGGAEIRGGFQLAQLLRELLDQHQLTGPVALVVDDVQWVDPESLEAISWVWERSAGDRLLVVAASRPLGADGHPAWRRALLDDRVRRIALRGLTSAQATELLVSLDPSIRAPLAERLWAHTDGNPLYLRALVSEHRPGELASADALPAPQELTRLVARRLDDLPPEARSLVLSAAVLGPDWADVLQVAAVAGSAPDTADEAVQQPGAAGLLEHRGIGAAAQVRVTHDLLRTAVLEAAAPAELRELHTQAAQVVASPHEALRHQVLATAGYDDALATRLDRFAADLHAAGDFHEASRFLRWAGQVTSDPQRREQRGLDTLFELAAAGDVDAAADGLSSYPWVGDPVRRTLVQVRVATTQRRWLLARDLLAAVPGEAVSAADPLVRQRFWALSAWALMVTGGSPQDALEAVRQARAQGVEDPAMTTFLTFAAGQAVARTATSPVGWALADDVEVTGDSPVAQLARQAWRGLFYAVAGRLDEAARDLDVVIRGVRDGRIRMGDGLFHALSGFSRWLGGDLPRGVLAIRLAQESGVGEPHPMVLAVAPLVAVVDDDRDGVVEAIRRARDGLVQAPWPAAIQVGTSVAILCLRLVGDDEQRARLAGQIRRSFGDSAFDLTGAVSPLWALHLGLAATWCGEVDLARAAARRAGHGAGVLHWAPAAVGWVEGLAAAAEGDLLSARALLTQARATTLSGLPVHTALLLDDLASVEERLGLREAHGPAAAARQAAQHLGLTLPGRDDPGTRDDKDVLAPLSARERDVVALVVAGLSYAQIAKELFVSRSTVAFHLSNVYAKTNTTSRHELVALVRRGGPA